MRSDHAQLKVSIRAADRLAQLAAQRSITIGAAVDLVCFAEIEAGMESKIERPGDVAKEMFRIARPEVRR